VIVDLLAEGGGNCELTRAGETVEHNGVRIIGPVNLPATVACHASDMYARNLLNFIKPAFKDGALAIDWNAGPGDPRSPQAALPTAPSCWSRT
jgi:NAD(P) transhydrogenase subunit alpha